MADSHDIQKIEIGWQEPKNSTITTALSRFISYLIFDAHFLRITLEIITFFSIILLISHLKYSAIIDHPSDSFTYIWLLSFFSVAIFDQWIINKPIRAFYHSLEAHFNGEQIEALTRLETLGPTSKNWVKAPKIKYHTLKATILAQFGRYEYADAQTYLAKEAGLSKTHFLLLKTEINSSRGDIETSEAELLIALRNDPKNSAILFQLGFLALISRKDLRKAKKYFEEAKLAREEILLCRLTAKELASYYLHIAKLWTGYAEEAREEITEAIIELQAISSYNPYVKPFLSWILLEQAYYCATHNEQEQALLDMQSALSLCKYNQHLRKVKTIKEELEWRYTNENSKHK